MNPFRRWTVRLLMALVVLIPLAATALYLINPLGVRSYDPRQRILGHGPYRVPANDMAPSLVPDQIVLVRAGDYRKQKLQRGDIVVFVSPVDGNMWIKRVVGLPGERISIDAGVLLIDDRERVEDYVAAGNAARGYSRQMHELTVPEASYFLLGDNRDNSHDGRLMGATPQEDITGRIVGILK